MRGRLFLPSRIRMTCGNCRKSFSVELRALDGNTHLGCPFCRKDVEVYAALDPGVRRAIYRAAREKIEERLVEELNLAGEFWV
ncbi:MAG: hypothetical protein HRF49_09995 [bacterium]|jgi:hypothetical protein